jgi:phenylacetate-CoA ligase
VEGIGEFKVIQHALDRVEVLVVPDGKWTAAGAAAIERGLQARLGADVRIETRVVEAIAPEASGKHRYVVSRVSIPALDALTLADSRPSAAAVEVG